MPATMCLVLLLLWLSPVAPNQETGSCSQPQPLCCLGTDHHCKRGSCYCDEFCHVASDCCPDHRALCDPASQNTKMVLRVVLRMEKPPGPARRHLGWMQSIVSALEVPQEGWRHPAPASLASRPQSQGTTTKQVQQLLQSSLPGMPLSISVKGIKKRA